jgi:alpha/beta superfamily hydrolase
LTPRSTERSTIDGPAGALEIAQNVPATAPRGIAIVAHPHPLQGGTLDNKVAQTLAKTFFALGYVAVRFNFRGVGQSAGTFDDGEGESADALAALRFAQARFDAKERALPIVLAGFSFGAFVQTRVARRVSAQRLALIGPAVRRFAVETVPADTIVIHGEEDDVVPLSDVFAWARPQELPIVVFPGCGHFFHGRLPQLQRVITGMWQRAGSPSTSGGGLG